MVLLLLHRLAVGVVQNPVNPDVHRPAEPNLTA